MRRLTDHLGDFIANQRLWAWALVGTITTVSVLGWCGFRVFEHEQSKPTSTAAELAMDEASDTFGRRYYSHALVLQSEDFFLPQRIGALRRLAAAFERLDSIRSVVWIGSIPKVSLLEMNPLLPPPGASPEEYRRAEEELARHPLVNGQLLSDDGRTMLMLVGVPFAADEVRRIATEACDGSGIRVRVTGEAPLMHSVTMAFNEDHYRIVLTACVLVFVLAIIIFRGLWAMLTVSAGPVLGLVWTVGLMNLFDQPSNPLADIILPVMILMIGFTDGVHLVVHIRQSRTDGRPPREAAKSAVCHVGPACGLTSITTAIGFGSLMISNMPYIRIFGRSSAIGVLITFCAVILVVPLLGSSWPGRSMHRGHRRDPINRGVRRLAGMLKLTVGRARIVAGVGVLFTAALAVGSMRLKPDDRLALLVPHNTEAYEAMQHCDDAFGGIRFVQVLIEWPEDAEREEIWAVLDRTERLLGEQQHLRGPLSVRHWLSIFSGPQQPGKLMLADALPEEFRRWFWSSDTRRTQVVAHVTDRGIARYEPTYQRVNSGLAEIQRRHPGFTLKLTGTALVRGQRMQRMIGDLAWSLALAAAVIFVVLSLAYRSIALGLISVIPNLFPLVATATLRAVWDTSLDIASACSFAVCLGIAVDDTIHFLTRFQFELSGGSDIAGAIRRTFVGVGNALVMTTVVMIAGMGTVLTCQTPAHQLFAAMGCITLAAALLADLIILPALLLCFFRRRL